MEQSNEKQYQLTLSYQRYRDDGSFHSGGLNIESRLFRFDDVRRLGLDYGISHLSSEDPDSAQTYFMSLSPTEDIQGEQQGGRLNTYHYLRLEAVHVWGASDTPSEVDLLELADALFIQFPSHAPVVAAPLRPRM